MWQIIISGDYKRGVLVISKFVRETAFGGYKEVQGGHSDPACSHVILTAKEYDDLLQKMSQAEQRARDERYKADNEKRESYNREHRTIQETSQRTEALKTALEKEQEKSAYLDGLNKNLLRMSRERANADRKLKPKKEHTGYVVVSSGEKELSYKDGGRYLKKKMLWETVIQSPYSVDFTEQQARQQITQELLQKDATGMNLIGQIGIDYIYGKGYGSLLHEREYSQEPDQFNVMLKLRFRENFRAGYWEVVFFHTKPLGIVPKDMRVN